MSEGRGVFASNSSGLHLAKSTAGQCDRLADYTLCPAAFQPVSRDNSCPLTPSRSHSRPLHHSPSPGVYPRQGIGDPGLPCIHLRSESGGPPPALPLVGKADWPACRIGRAGPPCPSRPLPSHAGPDPRTRRFGSFRLVARPPAAGEGDGPLRQKSKGAKNHESRASQETCR